MFTSEALPARYQYYGCLRSNPGSYSRVWFGLCLAWVLMLASAPGVEGAVSNGVVTLDPTNRTAAMNVPSGLRDIRGVVEIPSSWLWVWRGVFALAVAGLGWWAWRLWQKRAQRGATAQEIPADVTARDRLREALSLIDQPQPFCFAIAEITRSYLEAQFGLRAPDQTTEEFLADLQQSFVLDLSHKRVLEDFLTRCDLVKFARVEPARVELEDLHQAALRLVDETAGIRPPNLAPQIDSSEAPPPLTSPESGVDTSESLELAGEARYMPRETVGSGRTTGGGEATP